MPHFVFVIGTRAQLVKMAPVILAAEHAKVPHEVLLTGQHRESMGELANDLNVGAHVKEAELLVEHSTVQSLVGWFPVSLLRCLRRLHRRPADGLERTVIVHGDTASTLLGALAGRLAGLRVAHVESGLSSGALLNPFPEELIRRLVFRLSNVFLCPDEEAVARIRQRERCGVINTGGNTIVDSVRFGLERIGPRQLDVNKSGVVVSIHRFENIMRQSRLGSLVDQIRAMADEWPVKFVLHPPTEQKLRQAGLISILNDSPNVELLPRMSYTKFMALLVDSQAVITDGGSNQEELELLGIPTIILRDRTERSNGIGSNAVLEPDLPCGLSEYVLSGQYKSLRRPSSISGAHSPSRKVIEALTDSRAG